MIARYGDDFVESWFESVDVIGRDCTNFLALGVSYISVLALFLFLLFLPSSSWTLAALV